jgi:hypothetical protein
MVWFSWVYNFQFLHPWKMCSVTSWFPRINLSVATLANLLPRNGRLEIVTGTNVLTPWNWTLEKPSVVQLFKNWSLQSMPPHPIFLRSNLILCSHCNINWILWSTWMRHFGETCYLYLLGKKSTPHRKETSKEEDRNWGCDRTTENWPPFHLIFFGLSGHYLPLSSLLPWVLSSLPYVWTSISCKIYSYTLRKTAGSCLYEVTDCALNQ